MLAAGFAALPVFELPGVRAAAVFAFVAGAAGLAVPAAEALGELVLAVALLDAAGGATVPADELFWLVAGLALLFVVSVLQAIKKRATSETTKPSFRAFIKQSLLSRMLLKQTSLSDQS
jgi:hypothetical protein